MNKKRQIVLDTETTGLDALQGHRIIEIGCVELLDRVLSEKAFHYYINPRRSLEQVTFNITGITEEFLQDKPYFEDICDAFIMYAASSEIIIHNAKFDLSFLEHEFNLANKNFNVFIKDCTIVDTLQLARSKHPGQRNSLDALTERYDIKHFKRDKHGALLDATILAHVYLALTTGQGKLFDDSDDSQLQIQKIQKQKRTNIKVKNEGDALLVVYADPREIAEHDDYLNYIKKISGKNAIWQKNKN